MSRPKHIIVVGGGTAGAVLAARLSEEPSFRVTLLEAGTDHNDYSAQIREPARAAEVWDAHPHQARTEMHYGDRTVGTFQGRILGGTSAMNGMATLRGQPHDYDEWAARGLDGWGWADVADTFIRAETDHDFPNSPIHGHDGPLPVRRWRPDELSDAPRAYLDGMVEIGEPFVEDINDPDQLPGIGHFPVTIDADANRVSTSLAYLTSDVRSRPNLTVRTDAEVARVDIADGRVTGVTLRAGESIAAEEVVVCAGALWSPTLLLRSGVGPAGHLSEHGITVHADLPVGETMSDHLGPGMPYQHDGPRGGVGGPAQVVLIGASSGTTVDYHAFPVARAPGEEPTFFMMVVFLLRSSGAGSVRLGDSPDADPVVTAPPLPHDAADTLQHAFDRLARWERSSAAQRLGAAPVFEHDLTAPDAVDVAVDQILVSYGHMTSTCPMGTVLDAECRVRGIDGLRVADASSMPTIPAGNTYLGCVMIAERVAAKMRAEVG